MPSVSKDIMNVGVAFTCLDAATSFTRGLLKQDHLTPSQKGLLAGVNAMMVVSVLFPVEVVTRRLQVG